ncbi:MAG: HAD-IIIA family hydrolase [Bacteroidales bacterium]|nr:HAD-IIIA family hydrolase [Bacteroidales bacterium]MDD3201189.1 HAD-IIIA family hydrolase [Bacteroidales bacterium]
MECIILAGGLGTRLRDVVPDLPKCMAPVAGKPFLYYLISTLDGAGFDHIILSLGYMHEEIEHWLSGLITDVKISIVVENSPLGTGGAVKLALNEAREEDVFVFNGDTFFTVDYAKMMELHRNSGAQATIALKKMYNFSRYGSVGLDKKNNQITYFAEKQYCDSGLINAGIYIINKTELSQFMDRFSLEKDYFENIVYSGYLSGFVSDGYFIDIGVPEDYAIAQQDFRHGKYKRYDTLFLDRDGVLNVQIVDDYVKSPDEFEFIEGTFEAMKILSPLFARIFVVSNQRGVGRGLMSMRDLKDVNEYMCSEIEAHGGRIDKIYSCTDHDKNSFNRKPNIGMAMKIKEDFPEIDFEKCYMVGDTTSDIKFGNNAGIPAVLVGTKYAYKDRSELDIIGYYPDLLAFAKSL